MEAIFLLSDGRRVPARDGMVLGRLDACDLVIDDTKASRRHAKVIFEGGVAEIEDLGSSNGTLLNGKQVARRVLRPGDVVQIGKTTLTYLEEAGSAPAAPVHDGVDLFAEEPSPPPPPSAAPSPTAKARGVVEFEDEVVHVERSGETPAPGEPQVVRRDRVLQFSKHRTGRGALQDDLAQLGGWQKIAVIAFAVLGAVGLAYLVMELVSS